MTVIKQLDETGPQPADPATGTATAWGSPAPAPAPVPAPGQGVQGAQAVEWLVSDTPVPYEEAIARMEARVDAIRAGTSPELVWLLEHPPLYTAGTSARPKDLLDPDRFPVHRTGRGGEFTYHGPGQRVAYVMLDLKRRGPDLRRYVHDLEEWLILTLARFNVTGERRAGRVGIWVDRAAHGGRPGQEDKIAAIGVRVRRWVSFHGVSLNVEPDLEHFSGIVPCGIEEHGVTSLADLGLPVAMADVDAALRASWDAVIGEDAGAGGNRRVVRSANPAILTKKNPRQPDGSQTF